MAFTRRQFCQSALFAPSAAFLRGGSDWSQAKRQQGKPPVVNYMLRYFIRSDRAQQQTEELIVYCRQTHIRHIILFNDNNWDLEWTLPTLQESAARVEVLRPVVQRLRSAGLHVSLNMFATIGHSEFGRDERQRFSWQFMVGDDGTQSYACPCPLDSQWKSYIAKLYGLWAQLEPEIIYIDDDFRYHNHPPLTWGCFCPSHLAEMARRTGQDLSWEALVHRILTAEPQPTEERQQWLQLCGDSIVEATRIIAEAVKKVSPKTHMGLMDPGPDEDAAEGRPWLEMLQALSVSGHQPAFRPGYASYWDDTYRDAARSLTEMRKLQPVLAPKMHYTPELEDDSDYRFSKSVSLTRLQLALSFFLASPDITLDIHNFLDTRLDPDRPLEIMLRDSYAYFTGVAAWAAECDRERGLQILWDDRFPAHRKVETDRMRELSAPNCWEGAMDLLGFATTFYPEDVKLTGRSYLEERTDQEIRALLQSKVLMDGDAGEYLVYRGFGREIGVTGCEPARAANVEELTNRDFAGDFANQKLTNSRAYKYRLHPVEQAILVSQMFGPGRSFCVPGMMLFENASGGRIGIIPQSGSRGDLYAVPFRSWNRQEALKRMLEWINKGPVPLFVENAPNVCPLRRDGDKAVAIGIANLSGDPLPKVSFQLPLHFEGKPKVEFLTPEGEQTPLNVHTVLNEGYWHFRTPVSMEPLAFACFRLTAT